MYKKFGRFAVLGLVLVIIGSVTLCAFYFGGYDFNRINSRFNSSVSDFFIDSKANYSTVIHELNVNSDEEYVVNGEAETFYTSDSDISFNDIELDAAAGSFKILIGESFSIQATDIVKEYFGYSLDNDKLIIKYNPKITFSLFSFSSDVFNNGEIFITVPEKVYENIKIHVTGGDLYVEGLNSETLDFELTAGSATFEQVKAISSAKMYMSAGDLEFSFSQFANITFEMTAGTCLFNNCEIIDDSRFKVTAGDLELSSSSLKGNSEIDMTAGSVYMDLRGDISDYKINEHRTAGSISVESSSGESKNKNPDAPYSLNIKATAGGCNVYFR